jgi:hypothetical protein
MTARLIRGRAPAATTGSPSSSSPNAKVACTVIHTRHIRCSMTIKGGSGLSGSVTMRVSRAGVLVAFGHGRVTDGRAALTMRILHKMPRAAYTVKMMIQLSATKVLRLG